MSNTPNLNLILTPADDTTTTFQDWRMSINGDTEDSNMMKIDKAYGELSSAIEANAGSQNFVILATGKTDEGMIILDKTFDEMWEAYNEGKNLYLKGTLDGVEYSTIMLSSISPQRAIFAVAVEYTCIVFVVTSENGNLATPIMDEYVMRGELRDNYYTYEDVNAIFYKKEQVDDKLSAKADKSTTLSGYGITDAYTKGQVDTKINDAVGNIDLTEYYTKHEVDAAIQAAIADIKTYINETLLGGEW